MSIAEKYKTIEQINVNIYWSDCHIQLLGEGGGVSKKLNFPTFTPPPIKS